MSNMENVFKSFCAFGAGKEGAALMDNSKFAKLARDLKLLDKKLTSTDVDIIFNKVKTKSERKINFKQFQEGVKLMAQKKYPDDANGYDKLETLITSKKSPSTSNTTKTVNDDAVKRLTDTSKYTGTHGQRFDESGVGKGKAGRVDVTDNSGYVGGYKNKDSYDETH